MKNSRTLWTSLLLLALALAFTGTGCKKDEEGTSEEEALERAAALAQARAEEKGKKADPKKADPKKADPKKADPKKADKADPKKAAGEGDEAGAGTATKAPPHKPAPGKGVKPANGSGDAPEAAAIPAGEAADGKPGAAPRPEAGAKPEAGALLARLEGDVPAAEPATPDEAGLLGPRRDAAVRLAEREAAAAQKAAPGGTPAERAEAARKAATAGADGPPPAAAPAGPPLAVEHLLSLAEVIKITETKAKLKQSTLRGIPTHSGYNSVYFAEPAGERFGVALQVWKDANIRDSRWRYQHLAKTYPGVTENDAVTPNTFFAWWGDLYYLVFLVQGDRTTVALTCGRQVCSPEQLVELARTVRDRVETR